MTAGQWRPVRLARGEDDGAWAQALSADWRTNGTLVKGPVKGDGSGAEVWFAELCERAVVVKLWPMGSLKRRVQAVFRATPARRHWRGAAWLLEHELATAEPLALLRGRGCEALVMRRLPGRTLLEWMADTSVPVRRQHDLARACGRSVARLLSVGFNRDHKPSNLIVIESADGPIDLAIIDCVAIRTGPVVLDEDFEEDVESELAMLVIEALGCGVLPRRSLRMRGLTAYLELCAELAGEQGDLRRQCRKLWHRIGRAVEAHGDPTPRSNPLAQRDAQGA